MKKLSTILAGLFLLFSASAFTPFGINVSPRIKSSFEKDFASGSDVTWAKKEDLYLASFKAEDQNLVAAYNDNGDLLSVSREITLEKLPLAVSLALQSKYSGYNISNSVIELLTEGTTYFINAENEKYKVKLQADTAGNITVINKTKKRH
jgi:hypothetical protein